MEFQELKNYGNINTARLTAQALIASITNIPKELGIIGTPKFAVKMATKERYWKKKRFTSVEERQITHEDFLVGMRYVLTFYSALVGVCGREKAARVYPKLAQKVGVVQWEEFLPTSEDLLRYPDPFKTARNYWLGYFDAYDRENAARYEIIKDTEDEFQVHLTECAWDFMGREGGYPELAAMSGSTDMICIPKLMAGIGGDFKRETWLCRGDSTCDWHFFRHKPSD